MAITKLRKCRNLYHELGILEERLMFGCPLCKATCSPQGYVAGV